MSKLRPKYCPSHCSRHGVIRLLWFCYFHFRFGFGRFLAKNCSIGLSGFRFFTQKMSTALHRTIVETDQPITLRRTIHQMDNIVMFIYKLEVYVVQLLHCRIVESCPLTKLNGGLSRLHSADEDAVSWLTNYGKWHAYEKKKKIAH